MKRKTSILTFLIFSLLILSQAVNAGMVKTSHPVFLVPGAWGIDRLLGFDYFSDDYGNFVGAPCSESSENCNPWIAQGQKVHVLSIHTVQSSESRGLEIADRIEEYMAVYGYSHVNLIGHAQGGVCIRKAAKILRERFGYPVVKVLISISSPHRGTPVAKTLLDENPDIDAFLAMVLGDILLDEGNDGRANLTSMVFGDYDPHDSMVTGSKAFNERYPVSREYASRYASVICAQNIGVSPFVTSFETIVDGDGYCRGDCDGDGAAGTGDGDPDNRDDDGMVGINSQQMGYRLTYLELPFLQDPVMTGYDLGYAGDMNHPGEAQMTSLRYVLDQDHFDITGYGPDSFNEMEFFAGLFRYIALFDGN